MGVCVGVIVWTRRAVCVCACGCACFFGCVGMGETVWMWVCACDCVGGKGVCGWGSLDCCSKVCVWR